METTLLEYSKIILTKISFDESLFQKEFKKALKKLRPEERHELKSWAREYYFSES